MEHLSVFTAVASEVVANLCLGIKSHILVKKEELWWLFLWVFIIELWLTEKEKKKDKMDIFVLELFNCMNG